MGVFMQFFALLFMVGLSFVFHILVWENDYVQKWYWKIIIGLGILGLITLGVLGY